MDSNGGFTLSHSKIARTIDSAALEDKGSSAYDVYPNNQTARPAKESNQQAVLSAVKNLQEKILKLELGRKRAEEKLEKLKSESNRINENKLKSDMPSQTETDNQSQRLNDQLESAQSRCKLLEQQLLYMRTILNQADTHIKYTNGSSAISKDIQADPQNPPELKQTMQKSSLNPNIAEMKIQQLEEQLKLEQKRREMMEKKASQLQKAIEKNVKSKPNHPRKVPTCVSLKTSRMKRSTSAGLPHYRLNLKNIPFIAGKATTPSHNIGSNLQEVISLLKTHNPRLCALFGHQDVHSCANCPKKFVPGRTYSAPVTTLASAPKTNLVPPKSADNIIIGSSSSSTGSVRSESELSDLLLALQDEFGCMSFEQQEMVHQISQENSQTIRKELEKELQQLSNKIDVKSKQIAKLNAHIEKMRRKNKDTNKDRCTVSKNPESSESGEVLVITTVKTKGHKAQPIQVGHLPHRDLQLKMFKDIKTLQTTLKKDDVMWE